MPLHIELQIIYYALGIVVVIGGGLWKLSTRLARIETSVNLIKTNDLVHLDAKIDDLATNLREFKNTFIHYLEGQK